MTDAAGRLNLSRCGRECGSELVLLAMFARQERAPVFFLLPRAVRTPPPTLSRAVATPYIGRHGS
jgi:hypothetical protein